VGKINRGYFCRNCLIIIAYPDKKPGCRFAPFAFPMKTGMSLRSICNFAYLLNMWANAEKFANCVELVPDQELEENFTDEKYGNYR